MTKGIITITINNSKSLQYEKGVALEEIAKNLQEEFNDLIVAALVDGELKELNYILDSDCDVKFIDLSTTIGSRIYQRSLTFIFVRASMELLSGCKVTVEHSISKGLYCEIHYKRAIDKDDVERIEGRMREIISEDAPFIKSRIPVNEARDIFREYCHVGKVNLLKYREKPYINIYQCGWLKNYFYGYMVPSTGYIKDFKVQYYSPGIVLQFPRIEDGGTIPEFEEHPKLFKVFRESEKWGEILEIDYVASLNDIIVSRKETEFIRIAEALHEKKIAEIADTITKDIHEKRVILIAGPTSSGKTTFANRLMIQLKVNGIKPVAISLDDYFVNREDTPLDEFGEYDFESLYAIDIKLFNEHLQKLLKGEEVEIPTFNFHKGAREFAGHRVKISEDQPIILEGIHALNDELTRSISKANKFKIYISALTQLNIDEHNRIPTTDTRLIRRIVRDSKFRSNDALRTLSLWPSVRRGEEKNIFPFQEEADAMFNSALFYELSVLKKYAEPLLRQVETESPYYVEAKRLLKFLNYFVALENEEEIPRNSIMREFIGK
ncbi:nucleoside kinase [Serpentinicella alkaliphila]|uniref:Uridine kinase n=1 Tax=Serpentinicella alkaliphila TaxID=1734049 RepID=A0A4R2U335_9FIRM|nr:nucleoside kinase [Serpentinicella alkaliphila]QUH25966.1 Flp pilus assembly complex ATPase component TadA [Serpentinicella alkaliphila]TCQ02073.1 uridine kinase [Serpentinicella alkaliphila]